MTNEQIQARIEARRSEAAARQAEIDAMAENTQAHLDSGGRFIRQRKGRRVVTVAYRQTGDGEIEYGATIFQRNQPGESWRRDEQRQIALDRLQKYPVRIEEPEVANLAELDRYVRESLLTHGCWERGTGAVERLWSTANPTEEEMENYDEFFSVDDVPDVLY